MNQGGNYWTLFTPGIWKVLHAVLHFSAAGLEAILLPRCPPLSYIGVVDEMPLPPELESYEADAVAQGRYRDRAALVAAGVALLRERDAARAAFLSSVLTAEEEADRDGCMSAAEMLSRVRARLADKHSATV